VAITADVQPETLSVEPGESVACEIRLRNEGPGAVQLRVSVTGPASPYSWVAPDRVSLGSMSEEVVRVGFRVPRASTPAAGSLAYEVAATPAGLTAPAATAAGVVEVRPFIVLSAALSPPPSVDGGNDPSQHALTLGNRGNAPASTVLRSEADEGDLDVRVDPSRVLVAPGATAHATVQVRAKRRPLVGKGRTHAFRVVAEPDVGTPAEARGVFHQKPVVGGRTALVVALLTVVGLVAGLAVATSGGTSTRPAQRNPPAGGAALDSCPAKGHADVYGVRNLEPREIANLPDTYTFLRVMSDGCTPFRFNPCEPIHYVQNAAAAPPLVADNVREAFRRLSRATGIAVVDDGLTDETTRDGPYVPERYGSRWAPILIVWEHFPAEQTTGRSQILGNTAIMREQDVNVSARLRFNVDAYNDEFTHGPIEAGFGPPAGSGTGAIGRENITWGRIVLHELAHVMGLGHTRDQGSLMYPDAAQQTSRPAD
jgi:hypothetical protein